MSDLFDISAPALDFRTLTLERLKVAAQEILSPQVLRCAEFEVMDMVMGGLAMRLRAEILAERVLDTDVTLPWRGEVEVTHPAHETRGLGGAAVASIGALFVSMFFGGAAMLLALALVCVIGILGVLNAPTDLETETVPVSGEVTVPATYWRKFPEPEVAYPKQLGRYLNFPILNEPYFRQAR